LPTQFGYNIVYHITSVEELRIVNIMLSQLGNGKHIVTATGLKLFGYQLQINIESKLIYRKLEINFEQTELKINIEQTQN